MDNWEEQTQEKVERQTIIEKPKRINTPLVNGCLIPIAAFALMILCIRECKRSGVRLEQEKIKLEQMKKGILIDTTPAITPDTLKILGYQKTYIPLIKQFRSEQGR